LLTWPLIEEEPTEERELELEMEHVVKPVGVQQVGIECNNWEEKAYYSVIGVPETETDGNLFVANLFVIWDVIAI